MAGYKKVYKKVSCKFNYFHIVFFRNCIINVGETVVYDVAKEYLISSNLMVDGIHCHGARYLIDN